jgi:drug/metabolite transporter (DMT)-like permease
VSSKLLIALAIAFSGQVLYHFCQKAVAPNVNPIVALVMFYVVAALASLPLFAFFPLKQSVTFEMQSMNWAVIGVALSIVLIEVGFLLAYRAGGELSSAFVFTSAAVACTLLILGAVIHAESVTATKLMGLALSIAGIYFVSRS